MHRELKCVKMMESSLIVLQQPSGVCVSEVWHHWWLCKVICRWLYCSNPTVITKAFETNCHLTENIDRWRQFKSTISSRNCYKHQSAVCILTHKYSTTTHAHPQQQLKHIYKLHTLKAPFSLPVSCTGEGCDIILSQPHQDKPSLLLLLFLYRLKPSQQAWREMNNHR